MHRLLGVVGSSQVNGRNSTAGYANIVKLCKRVRQGGVMRRGSVGGGGDGRVGRGGIEGRSGMEMALRGGGRVGRWGVG